MMAVTKLFSRRWWYVTLFVILGVIFLARLGFWQLERLEERRAFNELVASRWNQEPFDLNNTTLPANLDDIGYRRIAAAGAFDYEHQVVLKNQNRESAPGFKLVTPLLLPNGQAILVVRGWIPYSEANPEEWVQFNEATDSAPIVGMLQKSQVLPGAAVPEGPQTEWFRVDIEAIQRQMPYQLLPVFLLQLPEPGRGYEALPYRDVPFELTEGNHFSYALQWFMFAVILGGGYLPYIAYQEKRRERALVQKQTVDTNPEPPLDAPALT